MILMLMNGLQLNERYLIMRLKQYKTVNYFQNNWGNIGRKFIMKRFQLGLNRLFAGLGVSRVFPGVIDRVVSGETNLNSSLRSAVGLPESLESGGVVGAVGRCFILWASTRSPAEGGPGWCFPLTSESC